MGSLLPYTPTVRQREEKRRGDHGYRRRIDEECKGKEWCHIVWTDLFGIVWLIGGVNN